MAEAFRFVDEDGTWIEILGQPGPDPAPVPALFLDRDGVVVVETHYLHEVEKTELIPGAGATIALANQRGLPVVMVTNQGGIGRGLYGWADFEAVQDRIKTELAAQGAHFDAICACA
jgi:D-glycero-D-manno-heptose 1,7-bisphosphate phosphatase